MFFSSATTMLSTFNGPFYVRFGRGANNIPWENSGQGKAKGFKGMGARTAVRTASGWCLVCA